MSTMFDISHFKFFKMYLKGRGRSGRGRRVGWREEKEWGVWKRDIGRSGEKVNKRGRKGVSCFFWFTPHMSTAVCVSQLKKLGAHNSSWLTCGCGHIWMFTSLLPGYSLVGSCSQGWSQKTNSGTVTQVREFKQPLHLCNKQLPLSLRYQMPVLCITHLNSSFSLQPPMPEILVIKRPY